jgi:hypothetical protein
MGRLVIVGFLVFAAISGCASMKTGSTSAGIDAAQGAAPPVSGRQPMPPSAAASPSQPDSTDRGSDQDLKATIALQGMPCDQLAEAKRNGDSDYTATCSDGNRYHIYVNAQGRVIVQKL